MPDTHPPVAHYNRSAIQPIDFFESSFTADEYRGYLKGNALKYIIRYRHKGKPDADLEKAQVYLGWLREFEAKQRQEEK